MSTLNKTDMLLLIMDFLYQEGYDRSYISLEEESGVQLYKYNKEIDLVRKLILDGEWEEVEKFLDDIKSLSFPYDNCMLELRKEKLLEVLELGQNDNHEELALELKEIQSLSEAKEFNDFMEIVESINAEKANQMKKNIISRRLNTFNSIRRYLNVLFPIGENEALITQGKFMTLFNQLMEKVVMIGNGIPDNDNEMNIALLEEVIRNCCMKCKCQCKNKTKVKTKDKTMNNNKKNIGNYNNANANRLQLNHPIMQNNNINFSSSENNEDNDNDNDNDESDNGGINKHNHYAHFNPLQAGGNNINPSKPKDNNISKENNQSKSKLKIIDIYENIEVNVEENKTEDMFDMSNTNNNFTNTNLNLHLNNTNDLSDLDQEEFYIKTCYDYYNYDITSLTLKKVIEDTAPIRASCFTPKGDYFAIGTNSRSIKIFDLTYVLNKFNKRNSFNSKAIAKDPKHKETIKLIFEQKYHHKGSIYCLDWSSSGKLLASGSNDFTIKLMNIPELDNSELGKEHETRELQLSGNKGIVRSVCFEPTNDLVLLSASNDEPYVKIWDTEKGVNVTKLEGHNSNINTVKWSNDSQLCASGGVDKTIRFWDLRDYKSTSIISAIKYADIHEISIYTKQKGIGNTMIAVGHTDGLISIWDYAKRSVVHEIAEHQGEVRTVAFSPDGKHLISGGFDGRIKIFDVENNFDLLGEVEHEERVVSCKWHPEIPLIVSTSDKTARVWIPQKY